MSREIKFRAWDDLNKKWLLGYEYPNLGGFSMLGDVMAFGEYKKMLDSFRLEDWDKIVLMQYTGIKDKNGVEIYEGDILERVGTKDIFMSGDNFIYADPTNKTRELVELKVSSNEFGTTFFGFSLNTQKTYSERTKPATYEIIGNIYENPELLNQ